MPQLFRMFARAALESLAPKPKTDFAAVVGPLAVAVVTLGAFYILDKKVEAMFKHVTAHDGSLEALTDHVKAHDSELETQCGRIDTANARHDVLRDELRAKGVGSLADHALHTGASRASLDQELSTVLDDLGAWEMVPPICVEPAQAHIYSAHLRAKIRTMLDHEIHRRHGAQLGRVLHAWHHLLERYDELMHVNNGEPRPLGGAGVPLGHAGPAGAGG